MPYVKRKWHYYSTHIAEYYWFLWMTTRDYRWYHRHIEEYALSINAYWDYED